MLSFDNNFLYYLEIRPINRQIISSNLPSLSGPPKLDDRLSIQNANVTVSVLAYPINTNFKDGIRDIKFDGNFRQECNLDFDCNFKVRHNHRITADFFYSMDAVVVGNEAVSILRKLFPSKISNTIF